MSDDVKLGNITITRIEEMHGPVMPTNEFFPDIPAQAWQEFRDELVPDHTGAQDGMVHAAFQSWLIRSSGRTILIDTGVGNDKTRPGAQYWNSLQTGYLDNLARAGVQPQDVDLVVNTHLHLDHVGWNTRLVDGAWTPTFPNATYLMPRIDFEYWNPDNNPNIAGSMNENAFADSIAPVHAAGQVQLWEDSHSIDGNLSLEAAPGHTPGAGVLKFEAGTERALFAGDLLHTPLQLRYPAANSCFCEDPAGAAATRLRLLGWAADRAALVLPAHFSGSSALEIRATAGGQFAVKNWAQFGRY